MEEMKKKKGGWVGLGCQRNQDFSFDSMSYDSSFQTTPWKAIWCLAEVNWFACHKCGPWIVFEYLQESSLYSIRSRTILIVVVWFCCSADGMMFGALANCPMCQSPIEYGDGQYRCKGFLTAWSKCSYTTLAPKRKAGRWKIPSDLENDYLVQVLLLASRFTWNPPWVFLENFVCSRSWADYW